MNLFGTSHHVAKAHRRGTHRTRSPAQTLEAYLPLANRMGITRLANIGGLDRIGLPVFVCVRPNARALSTAQGKGLDRDSAKASALMESIECWHAERLSLPARHESRRALGVPAVDLAGLSHHGPPHDDDVPLWWVPGWELNSAREVWVPFDAVSLNSVTPANHRSRLLMNSNGLASGNHPLEAICHGLLELIERDSEARWRELDVERQALTSVDPESVRDEQCQMLLKRITATGVKLTLFDWTSDLGVPTYSCTLFEPDAYQGAVEAVSGSGSHLCPEVALLRALTEAAQVRACIISGSRDDIFHRDYRGLTGGRSDTRPCQPRRAFERHSALPTPTSLRGRCGARHRQSRWRHFGAARGLGPRRSRPGGGRQFDPA